MGIIFPLPKQMIFKNFFKIIKQIRWSMVISHHPPSQYCRTYTLFGLRTCARCLGIPIGFIIMYFFTIKIPLSVLLFLPIPTFLNFLLQELKIIKGNNRMKTFLTTFLGGYVWVMIELFITGTILQASLLLCYLVLIQFTTAYILIKKNKLEPLIIEYERGVLK